MNKVMTTKTTTYYPCSTCGHFVEVNEEPVSVEDVICIWCVFDEEE